MKLVLCVLLVACCSLCGYTVSSRLHRHVVLLQMLSQALERMQMRVAYFADPVYTALHSLLQSEPKPIANWYRQAIAMLAQGESVQKALRESLQRLWETDNAFSVLDAQDVDALDQWAQGLGGDQATQQAAFAYIQSALSHSVQAATERQKQKMKLYRTSGVLCGLLLVVLFY